MGTSSMLDVAGGVSSVDPKMGRVALELAQQMAGIAAIDSQKAASYLEIASLWINLGDYRLARLAALRNVNTQYTIQSYTEILDAVLGQNDNAIAQAFLVGKHKIPIPEDISRYLSEPSSIFSN
jgi:hypothetical protein